MKKLYICGLQGGGKSLLHQLLDGHPDIFVPGFLVCPGLSLLSDDFLVRYLPHRENLRDGDQDFWYQFFRGGEISIKVKDRWWSLTIGDLWSYLLRWETYNVLFDTDFADWSGLNPSCELTQKDFCFTEFMEEANHRILSQKKFSTIELLQEAIYKSCQARYRTYPWPPSDQQYFLQRSNLNGIPPIQNILKHNARKKILVLKRSFVSSALMNAERLAERFPEMKSSKGPWVDKLIGTSFERALYSPKYIKKYERFYNQLKDLTKGNGDLFIVDFEEMILETEKTMHSVSEFLGIDAKEILNHPTLNGSQISHPIGVFDVGVIKHDPEVLLTRSQIDNLGVLYRGPQSDSSSASDMRSIRLRFWLWYVQPVIIRWGTWFVRFWRGLARL